MNLINIAIDALVLIVGFVAGYLFHRFQSERLLKSQQDKADNILRVATEQARLIDAQARESATKIVQASETEIKERRIELSKEADRLDKRRTELDGRAEKLEQRDQNLNKRQSAVDKRANDIDKLYEDQMKRLEQIGQLTPDEARKELLAAVEKESRADMARIYRQIEAEAREEGEKRARKLIADAIQRVASEHVAEVTSSVVPLPNEEMKGRIVGRNGRNIKAFEQAAGVDVIVDDTPEAVTISCFDSVRREIARRALTRLTVDGRIHPAHIEKILEEEAKAVDRVIAEAGEQAAFEAGITGLHLEVLRMMGRLKFRTSYGQNQLAHAVEVSKLAGILAAELGANVEISKQGGFLHDIGKAMDHNQDGTHAKLGAEYCKRYGVNPLVVNAIESHHHEVDQLSIEAVIAESADAISGARPGARREDLEAYIKRIRTLEELSQSFEGVGQAFAIQAGREVRVIVKPENIDDLASARLARDIAKKIEESMQYPGQIKVTVIRETRATEFAK
ncbi:MAG: ribonuclease Y [Chloroflexota bacterium]